MIFLLSLFFPIIFIFLDYFLFLGFSPLPPFSLFILGHVVFNFFSINLSCQDFFGSSIKIVMIY